MRGLLLILKAYYILEEMIMAGHIQESSKKIVLKAIASQEAMVQEAAEKNR